MAMRIVLGKTASRQSGGPSVGVAATVGHQSQPPSRASASPAAFPVAARLVAPVRALVLSFGSVVLACCAKTAKPQPCFVDCAADSTQLSSNACFACADVPPFKLAQMMAQTEDKSSAAYQRLTWDALRKSINGLVNKVSERTSDAPAYCLSCAQL